MGPQKDLEHKCSQMHYGHVSTIPKQRVYKLSNTLSARLRFEFQCTESLQMLYVLRASKHMPSIKEVLLGCMCGL